MSIANIVFKFKGHPLTHQILLALLNGYKRPNDKIHEMMSAGILESVKKGMYTVKNGEPEPFLLANHIWGPSYISTDSALSHYGLIPERVYQISSCTTKSSRNFNTKSGAYSYVHLPLPYYSFGITQQLLVKEVNVLIACPEKALFDKIVTTAGITLRSMSATSNYLLQNLRMDHSDIKKMDTDLMTTWLENSPKRESLQMLIKTIKKL